MADLRMKDVVDRYMAVRNADYLAAVYEVSSGTIRTIQKGGECKCLFNYERDAIRQTGIEVEAMKSFQRQFTYQAICSRWGVTTRTIIRYRQRMVNKQPLPNCLTREVA